MSSSEVAALFAALDKAETPDEIVAVGRAVEALDDDVDDVDDASLTRAELIEELTDHLRGLYYYPEGTVVFDCYQSDGAFDHQLAIPADWLEEDLKDPLMREGTCQVLTVLDGDGKPRPLFLTHRQTKQLVRALGRPGQLVPLRRRKIAPLRYRHATPRGRRPRTRRGLARAGASRDGPGSRSDDDPHPEPDLTRRPSEQERAV